MAAVVAVQRQRWQHGNGGSRAAMAVAARQRWQSGGGGGSVRKRGGGGSSAVEARRWRAAWQQHLQRGVSGGSTVAASAEWRRQHGNGTEMAGSRRQQQL